MQYAIYSIYLYMCVKNYAEVDCLRFFFHSFGGFVRNIAYLIRCRRAYVYAVTRSFCTLSIYDKIYKIHTFGLICCRIISGVLFTHVHIKFDDGWWHILYSVQPNTTSGSTKSWRDRIFFFWFSIFFPTKKSSSRLYWI